MPSPCAQAAELILEDIQKLRVHLLNAQGPSLSFPTPCKCRDASPKDMPGKVGLANGKPTKGTHDRHAGPWWTATSVKHRLGGRYVI